MRQAIGIWRICVGLLLAIMLAAEATAASVELTGYFGSADPARISKPVRMSGDGNKIVYVENLSNNFCCQSLSTWVSAQSMTAADAARVWLYDIALQTRTLLYESKFSSVTVGADTLLQNLEAGFSVDINRDGSKVAMAYTFTTFSPSRDALTNTLKIALIDTSNLAVTPVASFRIPGFQAPSTPLRMSENGGTAVFAYEAVEAASTPSFNVWGVSYFGTSKTILLMAVPLTANAAPVPLATVVYTGDYSTSNDLVAFLDARYASFFGISADGTKVVFQYQGTGKVMGMFSDGSGSREIAAMTPAKAAFVSIAGDGNAVAYADRGGDYAILYANVFGGGQQREITRNGTYWAGNLILNFDGSALLYHTSDAGPGGSFGYSSFYSYLIATDGTGTPVAVNRELLDASEDFSKVLTSRINEPVLFLNTLSLTPSSTTTSTSTSTTSTTTSSLGSTTTTTTTATTTTTTLPYQGLIGRNLLVNADAEAGTGSADGSVMTIPGWNVTGAMTAVSYQNSIGAPSPADPGPVNRGMNLFAGGPNEAVSAMSQSVDISAPAGEIDAGYMSYMLSGFFGGWGAQADNAVLSADFKNAAGAVISSATVGAVSNADRNNATGLQFRETMGAVPSGARSVEVKLQANRLEGAYNDGYADNLAFVLAMGGGGSTTTTTSASTTTTGSTTTTTLGGGGAVTLDFLLGWNLVGNSNNATLDVASAFGDGSKVATVWKWLASKANWAFYTPTLGDGGAAYATSKGYDFMTSITGGEGFWVNAKTAFSASLPSGAAIESASFQGMGSGWNLIAIGDNKGPRAFNNAISLTPPAAGDIPLNLITLWAWDAGLGNWYFYAPNLDKSGGLANYITSKGYLDFGSKLLDPTIGFWVNKP